MPGKTSTGVGDAAGWSLLQRLLSEENSDLLITLIIEKLRNKVPFWLPLGIVEKVLDHLLPEVLLDALGELHATTEGVDATRAMG